MAQTPWGNAPRGPLIKIAKGRVNRPFAKVLLRKTLVRRFRGGQVYAMASLYSAMMYLFPLMKTYAIPAVIMAMA